MSKSRYDTNLAAEYYVLSMLYRYGVNAFLTLGNKKSVDIIIENPQAVLTIDVKGMAGKTVWPLDNFTKRNKNHFIILVSFLGKMNDCNTVPEVYIVPSMEIDNLMYRNPKGTRQGIQLSRMRKTGNDTYKNNWGVFLSKLNEK